MEMKPHEIATEVLGNVKIKQERLTPPLELKIDKTADVSNKDSIQPEPDKKSIEPVKSSNEILAELFQVFNAAPPKELLTVDDGAEPLKKNKKKSKDKKHHKKRKHDEIKCKNEDDEKRLKKKLKKIKKEKNATEGSDSESRKHKKSKKRHKEKDDNDEQHHSRSAKDIPRSSTKSELIVDEKKASNKSKILITNLKNSKILENTESERKRSQSRKNSAEESGELSSDISLSDLEESSSKVKHENDGFYSGKSFYDRSISTRDHDDRNHRRSGSTHRSREHGHHHHEFRHNHDRNSRVSYRDDYYRRSSYRSHRSLSRSKSRSVEREKIDKKRLLEIARKNAITMLKSGTLPGSQYLAPEIKEKALEKMRFGGKTVEELTEYCRKLSNGESLGDLSSVSDEDSDHDKEGNDKAFHHPFVLKERGPIVMNIKVINTE